MPCYVRSFNQGKDIYVQQIKGKLVFFIFERNCLQLHVKNEQLLRVNRNIPDRKAHDQRTYSCMEHFGTLGIF